RLGQPGPNNLRVRVNDRRDRALVPHNVLAVNDLNNEHTLVHDLVGEHRLARDVADRVDVRDGGPHLVVDLDEAAVGDVHARLVNADLVTVQTTAHTDQHAVERLLVLAVLDRDAVIPGRHRLDLGLEVDRLIAAGDPLLQHLG